MQGKAAGRLAVVLGLSLGLFPPTVPAAEPSEPATRPADGPGDSPGYHLAGFAVLPADTFADGPVSGQFIGPGPFNGRTPPFNSQPVQGFSSIIRGDAPGEFLALSDNGYGSRKNSADYLLRVYRVRPDFKTADGGTGKGTGTGTGKGTGEVIWEVAFTLSDPNRQIPWPIVADGETYPDSDVPVPDEVREKRLLTGADLDLESFVRLPDGTFWIGDEFGPFLVHVDGQGRLLRPPVELPGEGMWSPDHPTKPAEQAKIPRTGGLESMVLVPGTRGTVQDYDMLFGILERPIAETDEAALASWQMKTDDPDSILLTAPSPFGPWYRGTGVVGGAELLGIERVAGGDRWPAGRESHFAILERDSKEGEAAEHKQIAFATLRQIDRVLPGGTQLRRTGSIDLLAIPDPHDLDGDGQNTFRFPFVTIESICLVDDRTLLVANDNNYPFSTGRDPNDADHTEFILIRFDKPLAEVAADR
ncbi:MAG: esterase-like activity of phytase family protein [Phycisphaerae bacterium]